MILQKSTCEYGCYVKYFKKAPCRALAGHQRGVLISADSLTLCSKISSPNYSLTFIRIISHSITDISTLRYGDIYICVYICFVESKSLSRLDESNTIFRWSVSCLKELLWLILFVLPLLLLDKRNVFRVKVTTRQQNKLPYQSPQPRVSAGRQRCRV